jgi:gamma-glutamyltranspeptidase/glutathione hydrolase
MVLNVIEWDMNLAEAVHKPRIHHQWLPDIVFAEPGISRDTLNRLSEMGHNLRKDENGNYKHTVLGRVNSVGQGRGVALGSADPR